MEEIQDMTKFWFRAADEYRETVRVWTTADGQQHVKIAEDVTLDEAKAAIQTMGNAYLDLFKRVRE